MANKKTEEPKQRFSNNDSVARKIYDGVKKEAIKFGDVIDSSTDDIELLNWTAEPLPNGAIVSFSKSLIKTAHQNGKKRNPRYKIRLEFNKEKQEFSGPYARKIYERLVNPPRTRSTELDEEKSAMIQDALSDF